MGGRKRSSKRPERTAKRYYARDEFSLVGNFLPRENGTVHPRQSTDGQGRIRRVEHHSGPVEPNLCRYSFIIDGVSVADSNNANIFPNERFKNSLIDIHGDTPAIHDYQDVPHGKVDYCYYHSKTLGTTRPLLVYTPPGYSQSNDSFPVLYLVSGTTDTEETWFKVGRANFILDNLIGQKKAVPMIIAMPYGNMMTAAPNPSSPEAAAMYKRFSEELTTNTLPFVESNDRVKKDRESLAITGFSRGGGQSLFTGFANFDKFASIGSYSADVCRIADVLGLKGLGSCTFNTAGTKMKTVGEAQGGRQAGSLGTRERRSLVTRERRSL